MGTCGHLRNQTKCVSFERIWWQLSKNLTFTEFKPFCQKLWAFMSSFTMTTHQIWSCHVTLAVNFENFYFSPDSTLDFRKSYQVCCLNWLKNKKVTGKKLIRLSFLIIHKKQKAFDNFHFLVSCLCSVMTKVTETRAVNPPFLAVRLPVLEAASQSPYSNRNLSIYLKIIRFQA